MDIASMLNESSGSGARGRVSEQPSLSFANRGSFISPSVALPTPSPEYIPSHPARKSGISDSRRPWDGAAFSLPLTTRSNHLSSSVLPVRVPREPVDRVPFHRSLSSTDSHQEHGSLELRLAYGAPGFLPLSPHSQPELPLSSMVEIQQDIRRDRSFDGEAQARRESARFDFWPENPCPVATRTSRSTRHRFSESRSSLSSYGSSTFSGGHSRISSVSTVCGRRLTSPMPADVAMSEVNMEAAPGSSSVRRSANTQRTMPEYNITMSSPESIPEDRGNKRKRSSFQGDDSSAKTPSPSLRVANLPSHLRLRSRVVEHARQIGLEQGKRLRGKEICLFLEECDRDSPWRKVISHIFGRNKVCTRRVPERVWVSICRKHYQRTRYRKGPDYAKIQIQLVLDQIIRMIFWSIGCEENGQSNIEGVTIQSWTFSIRKRELNRLLDSNEQSQVPRWIIENLGSGKTHEEIIEIAQRLRTDIEEEVLPDLPPIEFLPEVVESTQSSRRSQSTTATESSSSPTFTMTNDSISRSDRPSSEGTSSSSETIRPSTIKTSIHGRFGVGEAQSTSSDPQASSQFGNAGAPGGKSSFTSYYANRNTTRHEIAERPNHDVEGAPQGQPQCYPQRINQQYAKVSQQPVGFNPRFSNVRPTNQGPRPTSDAWSRALNEPLSPPLSPPCCMSSAKNHHSLEDSLRSDALVLRGQSAPPITKPRGQIQTRPIPENVIKNSQILVAGDPSWRPDDLRVLPQDKECFQMQGPWPRLPPGCLPILAIYPVDALGRPAFSLAGYWFQGHNGWNFFPTPPEDHSKVILVPIHGPHGCGRENHWPTE